MDYFGPRARAYRACVDEASAQAPSRRGDARFAEIEGAVTDVGYRLESAERGEDGTVLLVVVEAVTFRSSRNPVPSETAGSPRPASTWR